MDRSVIEFVFLLLGDTPALKGMCRYSSLISKTSFVRMPCRICKVLMSWEVNDGIYGDDEDLEKGLNQKLDLIERG